MIRFDDASAEDAPAPPDLVPPSGQRRRTRSRSVPTLDGLHIKAVVEDDEGQRIALLETDGHTTHIAREGETLVIPGDNGSQLVKIRKITGQTLRVVVGNDRREFLVQ